MPAASRPFPVAAADCGVGFSVQVPHAVRRSAGWALVGCAPKQADWGIMFCRRRVLQIFKENNMKKLMTICFALCFSLALLTLGVASAQDNMKNDNMGDASKKAVEVRGKISDDGKMFVSDKDSKSWTIVNPEAVKGHEGHHVALTAHVYPDKNEVHVMSLKMVK
jgi:pentapeptide MXKDX repeat protein